jgi:hypothetical protein
MAQSSASGARYKYTCFDSASESVGSTLSETNIAGVFFQEMSSVVYSSSYPTGFELNCAVCAVSTASVRGASYIRYGRTVCPATSALVYSGFMAGSPHDSRGASSYLCLPSTAQFSTVVAAVNTAGLVRSGEYELGSYGIPRLRGLQDRNVLCASCIATGRRTTMLVPGRRSCPDRWILDYNGYLVSQHYTHARAESVCLDYNPEFVQASTANENGALFYPTEVESFPANTTYAANYELTCAQCSSDEGPVYVRWGVRNCPQQHEVVYRGWAGGGSYDQGGSATVLCMPDQWEQFPGVDEGTPDNENGALIYFSEYQMDTNNVPSYTYLHDEEVGCAVCQTRAPSVFVQYGSQTCPYGTVA